MNSSGAVARQKVLAPAKTGKRSPLGQLLHALNQPLTGLQCSMEVALAVPRTVEEYAQGLRQGLELTERMRRLVGAIREITDNEDEEVEGEGAGAAGTQECDLVLRSAVGDFAPVAESRGVRIGLDLSSSLPAVKLGKPQLAGSLFRVLDSIVALAREATLLRIASGSKDDWVWVRIEWQGDGTGGETSPAELGLLVAQARLERAGAAWEREWFADFERLTLRLPRWPRP
jgi:signal transduction histidine kinase